MTKHIILWQLKDDFSAGELLEIKKGIKENLESLFGKIPGLLEIKVSTEGLSSSTSDLLLYSVFENEEALKGYATHPEHVFVADTFVRPFTKTRACFDFNE
jgi:hypothetical protein